MAVIKWSPTDQTPVGAWELTGSNLTATESTNVTSGIRASAGKATGRVYWEVTASATASFDAFVGFLASTTSVGAISSGASYALRSNGTAFGLSPGASFASGETVCFALDIPARKAWARIGSGAWLGGGDPTAGTLPTASDLPSGTTWLPAAGSDNNSGNHTFVGRFADFLHTPPAGFSAFSDTVLISGTVRDATGAFAARTVLAYERSTGLLSGSGVSDAETGAYQIPVTSTDPHFVVALPTSTTENALVLDRVIPSTNAPTDPDFASVALLLHLDADFTDTSPAARTATTVANVSIAAQASMIGGSAATSSTTPGQLLFASSEDFATDADWTLEFNIYCTTFAGGPYFMAQSAVRYFNLSGTGDLQPVNWAGGSAQLTLNTRHHVAISHQDDNTTRLFLDGVLLNTSGFTGAAGASPFDVFGVPGRTDLPSFTQGYIDEVRWSKVCRYTATFTPPADPHPDA